MQQLQARWSEFPDAIRQSIKDNVSYTFIFELSAIYKREPCPCVLIVPLRQSGECQGVQLGKNDHLGKKGPAILPACMKLLSTIIYRHEMADCYGREMADSYGWELADSYERELADSY